MEHKRRNNKRNYHEEEKTQKRYVKKQSKTATEEGFTGKPDEWFDGTRFNK